jgi:hypothetical protein
LGARNPSRHILKGGGAIMTTAKRRVITDKASINDIYLKIWAQQQESVKQRWSVITFFFTISFAIFGFSLQIENLNHPIAGTFQRIAAVVIYWFTYLIYRQYSDWSGFLRKQLEKIESEHHVIVPLQFEWQKYSKGIRQWFFIKNLLLYFGLLYTLSTILLFYWFHI